MTNVLDERAAKKTTNPEPKVKKKETPRITKINNNKRGPVIICKVDTNNEFTLRNKKMYIDVGAKEYAPISTKDGQYYAMDEIYVFTEPNQPDRYFNQSIDIIDENMISDKPHV